MNVGQRIEIPRPVPGPGGRYYCELCPGDFGFSKIKGLMIHRTIVHHIDVGSNANVLMEDGRQLFQCSVCSKRFITRKKLRQHDAVAHPSAWKATACTDCGRVFKSAISAKKHRQQVHPAGSPVTCPTCHKVYKTEGLLRKHKAYKHTNRNENNAPN